MSGGEAAAVTKFVTTAVTTVLKLWRWRHPDTNSVVLRGWADKLAKSVQRDESTRLAQLGVDIGAEIRLSFDVDGARTSRHSATKIGEFYRSVPTRRLAVLGGPGAGKTVTIIQLLLDSIAHRLDHRDPVPVRVNCSRWDSQHTDIDECLIKVLTVDYHCNATIATALVRSGYNLPLFDGLDEIDPVGHVPREARQLLDELNEPPWRSRPVIVVCRTDTYRNARGLRPGGDAG
ncbi:MAG: hypothetical protein J2P17_35250, partial [Mycobacterium sp.]|nr:hypothetical protein [Mycobacterium sp.]